MSRSLFVSWQYLAEQVQPTYFIPPTRVLRTEALQCANRWIDIFQTEANIELEEEERTEIKEVFIQLAMQHWSFETIIKAHFPLPETVETVNGYAHRTWAVSDRELPRGDAISDVVEDTERGGVFFVVEEPVITAYVEAKQCSKGVTDEGLEFKNFTVDHLIDVFIYTFDCDGREVISFDLSEWGKAMKLPTYEEIEKRVNILREQGDRNERAAAATV